MINQQHIESIRLMLLNPNVLTNNKWSLALRFRYHLRLLEKYLKVLDLKGG